MAANHNLQRAAARVAEARALARLSSADLYPSLSATASSTRFRTRANGAGNAAPAHEASEHRTQFELGFELDFWGRVRRATEAAHAEAAAIEDAFHVARLTLTAEAARFYHQHRALDAEKSVLAATAVLRRETVLLQDTRYQAGLINEADVTRARTELATVEAEIQAVTRSRAPRTRAGRPLRGVAVDVYRGRARGCVGVADRSPERLASQLRAERAASTILLVKALGGGWQRDATAMGSVR